MRFKYVRIQGKEKAVNTNYAKGVFSMCWKLIQDDKMEKEDADLFREIDKWFAEKLPFPPQCNGKEKVICYFKTDNSQEMMKMITPAMWLLERYNHPFYVVYTNFPGKIVYEDEYQVAVEVDDTEILEEYTHTWTDPNEEIT